MTFRLHLSELHEAAFSEDAFTTLLEKLTKAVGARSYVVGWHYRDRTAAMLRHSRRWTKAQIDRYNREFALTDIWNVACLANWRPNRALNASALVSDQEYERSELYNEFFRAIGDDTFRSLSVPTENEMGIGAIAFHRGRGQPDFGPSAVQLLDRHARELAHLLALRGRFSALERIGVINDAILDIANGPVLLTTDDATLVHANVSGRSLLNQGEALKLEGDRVTTSQGGATQKLRSAIAMACAPSGPQASTIALPRAHQPLFIAVTPIRLPGEHWRALLLVHDPYVAEEKLSARLQCLFDLTRAEAEIAASLAAGKTPIQIAALRGVSQDTVRGQIKTIAAKLGCSRQVEIVVLVKSIPPIG